jgi:hypothetical protein
MATSLSAEEAATNRRRFPRHAPGNFEIPVRVDDHAARMLDLSLLGLRVETEKEYVPGTLVPVELALGRRAAAFKALVRRSEPACVVDEGLDIQVRYHLAMEILRDPHSDTTVLEDLVTLLYYHHWVGRKSGRA